MIKIKAKQARRLTKLDHNSEIQNTKWGGYNSIQPGTTLVSELDLQVYIYQRKCVLNAADTVRGPFNSHRIEEGDEKKSNIYICKQVCKYILSDNTVTQNKPLLFYTQRHTLTYLI